MEITMKLLNPKMVLVALGTVALLASPAFAAKKKHTSPANQAETTSQTIPGYAADGSVVAVPDPDHRGQAQLTGDLTRRND
jgi:hypothetical protein